jgi:putative spermidine/putrescine transport system substrate-binding protein
MQNTVRFSVAALSLALAGSAFAQARDLNIVSWGGAYQDAQKIVYFSPLNAMGVKNKDEPWDGGVGVLRTKMKGGNNTWDLVQVESDELEVGCDEGLYEKLDYSKIGGAGAYLPAATHPCGVGAIQYNYLISYDSAKLKTAPNGWGDFFDSKKVPGKRALRNGAKWNLEAALMADGVPAADVYKALATPAGIDRAFRKLDTIKADLVFWKSGAQPAQMLAAGDVVMTTAYNGRITSANEKDGKAFKMVWPGSVFTLDSWVIMKGSPNKAAAEKALAFMGDAANQKNLPKYIRYGLTNAKASSLVDGALMAELPTNPANMQGTLKDDAKFWVENGDKLAERWNKWAGTK